MLEASKVDSTSGISFVTLELKFGPGVSVLAACSVFLDSWTLLLLVIFLHGYSTILST